jgi:GrpB-like predicted nucleotidyltransferase (UPF0157 family)
MTLGLRKDEVRLATDHETWARLFQEEAYRISQMLEERILEIQHVGSTSIQGVYAKPILDIAIAVSSFEEAFECVPRMESLEYVYRGEYGIPRRHYFVKGQPRTHHVHVLEQVSEDWLDMILFRDSMRAIPELAEEYSKEKQRLAKRFPNKRKKYQAAKDEIVEHLLERARNREER